MHIREKPKDTITVTKFKAGDELMHINNWNAGLNEFFIANKEDVLYYSGRNGWYLKRIKT